MVHAISWHRTPGFKKLIADYKKKYLLATSSNVPNKFRSSPAELIVIEMYDVLLSKLV